MRQKDGVLLGALTGLLMLGAISIICLFTLSSHEINTDFILLALLCSTLLGAMGGVKKPTVFWRFFTVLLGGLALAAVTGFADLSHVVRSQFIITAGCAGMAAMFAIEVAKYFSFSKEETKKTLDLASQGEERKEKSSGLSSEKEEKETLSQLPSREGKLLNIYMQGIFPSMVGSSVGILIFTTLLNLYDYSSLSFEGKTLFVIYVQSIVVVLIGIILALIFQVILAFSMWLSLFIIKREHLIFTQYISILSFLTTAYSFVVFTVFVARMSGWGSA